MRAVLRFVLRLFGVRYRRESRHSRNIREWEAEAYKRRNRK